MAQRSRRMWPLIGVLATMALSSAVLNTAASATETTPEVPKAPPIVGGEPASIAENPWVVYLAESGKQFCGGTLVQPTKVVTAAHCVQDRAAQGIEVVAGREDTQTDEGTVGRVSEVWVHPEFTTPERGADVAVLTVDTKLGDQHLEPASREDSDLYTPGTEARVLGWGATTEGGASSNVLREATVPITTDQDCSAAYGSQYLPQAMVCAGFPQGGTDACQGDSGGPLVAGDKLIGVVSFGNGCARPENPGVYARVATYYEDIQAQLDS